MRFKKRLTKILTEVVPRAGVAGATLLVPSVLLGGCSDEPETFVGFDSYFSQGYEVVSLEIPTVGDVTIVENTGQLREFQERGLLALTGPIRYTIKPDRRFLPAEEGTTSVYQSDSAWAEHWTDTRTGTIWLKKQSKNEVLGMGCHKKTR